MVQHIPRWDANFIQGHNVLLCNSRKYPLTSPQKEFFSLRPHLHPSAYSNWASYTFLNVSSGLSEPLHQQKITIPSVGGLWVFLELHIKERLTMCMQALVKDYARRKTLGVRKQQTYPWGGGGGLAHERGGDAHRIF